MRFTPRSAALTTCIKHPSLLVTFILKSHQITTQSYKNSQITSLHSLSTNWLWKHPLIYSFAVQVQFSWPQTHPKTLKQLSLLVD